MVENNIQRVAAIHDLSCFGKASLTVVIPVLSSMGIQVCPLPTALLSAHTAFPGFSFLDLTDEMIKIINHWKALGLSFDAIYSGFLGSPRQIDVVLNFIREFGKAPKILIVVDPVMGDKGILYETITLDMVEKMRELVSAATIITPNLTELTFLAGVQGKTQLTHADIEDYIRKVSNNGPRIVIVTSAPAFPEDINSGSVIIFDRECDTFSRLTYYKLRAGFSGTGDTFTSVMLGCLLRGDNLHDAVRKAHYFVERMIYGTTEHEKEISLEKYLIQERLSSF